MHIKLLYRKVLYVFLSLMIVISSTQNAVAASPAGWVAQSTYMEGAVATINAVKGGGSTAMKAVIQHTPTAVAVGKNIVQLGGVVAVAYAVNELVGAGVDWVLDPSNNSVRYTIPATESVGGTVYQITEASNTVTGSTPQDACTAHGARVSASNANLGSTRWRLNSATMTSATNCRLNIYYDNVGTYDADFQVKSVTETIVTPPQNKSIPYSAVAEKITSNAASGHAPSQDFLKSAAVIDVNDGAVDANLDAVAVPDASGGTDPNPDTSVTFDPSSIIAALQSLMSAVTNMSSSIKAKMETMLVELGLMNAETNKVINESVDRVIANDNINVGELVAAIEAIEGNTLDGQVINDAVDRVIAEGKTNTSDIVAAIEAIEGNTLDGQVINDAVDRVIANDNVNAQAAADAAAAAADAATAAADAATAADAANTAAVTDAIGAQTDAITTTDPATGEKSLKLPAFCGFAPVVCDYITWVKGEYQSVNEWVKAEPEVAPNDPVVVADDPSGLGNIFQDKAEAGYVSFESSCPADVLIPIDLMGASQVLNISYTPFCHFASMIRYAVILGAWISGLLIVTGGRSRE